MHSSRQSACVTTLASAAALALVCGALAPLSGSGKSTAPIRIILGWAGDTATSRAVTWRTAATVAAPEAQIGVAATAGEGPAGPAADVAASARAIRLDNGRVVTHYRADFTGLKPATTYAYRVGEPAAFSAWHRFTTASAGTEPFRFIYLGDAQNGLEKRWPPLVRAAFSAVPDARFVAYAGDLVGEGYDDGQWESFFDGLRGWATGVPGVPAPGNHDLKRSPFLDVGGFVLGAPLLWNAHFALPDNGPSELRDLPGQNYFVDYQGLRIVAVDVNAFANRDFEPSQRARVKEALLTWLRRVLDTNPRRWTIVVQHQPMYTMTKDRDFTEMRGTLGPVYDRAHVDLVLQGHDHVYARTHKLDGGRLAAPGAQGTIYVTSVSGSKMYRVTTTWKPLMAVVHEGDQLYQVISVREDRLSYESRKADGTLVDAFSLSRVPGAGQGAPTILSEGLPTRR